MVVIVYLLIQNYFLTMKASILNFHDKRFIYGSFHKYITFLGVFPSYAPTKN